MNASTTTAQLRPSDDSRASSPATTATGPSLAPRDVLDELGLLPSDADRSITPASDNEHNADAATTAHADQRPPSSDEDRRRDQRHPTTRRIRMVMLAHDEPVGGPFEVEARDVSHSGVRVVGQAPLLQGSRAAIEVRKRDGAVALVGGRITHTTFGRASRMTGDNTSTAGLEFFRLDDGVVAKHFVGPDGAITLGA